MNQKNNSSDDITFGNLKIHPGEKLKDTTAFDQYSENLYSYTDLGNAERLCSIFGDKIDFIYEKGKFAFFNGIIHVIDESGKKIHTIYKNMGKEMVKAAYKIDDKARREAALKWCKKSELYKTYATTLEHLKKMQSHYLSEYDSDEDTIPCLNGLLNLKTFELIPASPDIKNLKVVKVKYNPAAKCPRWEKFIEEITSKDGEPRPELANYLHKISGYIFIKDTSEKCIFFFYGATGDNGKTTYTAIISYILGAFSQRINSSSLMKKYNANEMRNDLAKLIGARLVVGSEISKGQTFDDGLIRDLVGGDEITCRFLRQEFFTYTPIYKLILYGNNKPRIDADDPAIKNKIKMIPFDFQPKVKDRKLKRILKAESEGIFNWMVEGLKKYYDEGLEDPAAITELTTDYFNDNDILGRFLSEKFIITPGCFDSYITKQALYDIYVEWAKGENLNQLSPTALGKRLKDKAINSKAIKISGKTFKCWTEIKVKSDENEILQEKKEHVPEFEECFPLN